MKLNWFYPLFAVDDGTDGWVLLYAFDHYYCAFLYFSKFRLAYSSIDCSCSLSYSASSVCWLYFSVSSSINLITLSVIRSCCLLPAKAVKYSASPLCSLYSAFFLIVWSFFGVCSFSLNSLLLFLFCLPFCSWLIVNSSASIYTYSFFLYLAYLASVVFSMV